MSVAKRLWLKETEQRKARVARFMKYWQRDVATRQGRKKARRLDMGHSSGHDEVAQDLPLLLF